MTATLPARGPSTPVDGLTCVSLCRPRSVYGIPIFDPATGETRIDYVGQTKRAIAVREAEHGGLGRNPDCEQPWSDLIRGRAILLERDAEGRPWTDVDLDARERVWIRNLEGRLPHRPRYNIVDGLDHDGHIPKWEAEAARAARDRAQGIVSRWTNPELFTGPVLRANLPVGPSLWSRFWRSPFGRWLYPHLVRAGRFAAAVGGLWLALFVVLAWGLHLPVGDAAGGALALTVLGVAMFATRKRGRRKTARRNQRRIR